MANATIFISASDARQNPIRETVIHDEARAIESVILEAVKNGLYEATLSDGSPMTSSSSVNIAVAAIDMNNDQLYIPNHPFKTGDLVTVSSNGTLPSPLNGVDFYSVIYIDTDHIKLAASTAAAFNSRPISIDFNVGITDIEVTNSGFGYLTAPNVTIDTSPTGVTAKAKANLKPYGSINNIAVVSSGQGYTDEVTVELGSVGDGATAGPVSFKVVSVNIANGGTNYRVGDILTVSGGTGQSATVIVTKTISTGIVSEVVLNLSGLYSVLPSLSDVTTTVYPTGGTGCTLNLSMGIGKIEVSNGGMGYINPPVVSISGNGIGAYATAIVNAGVVTDFVITNSGSGYTMQPLITLDSGNDSSYSLLAVLKPTGLGGIVLTNNGGNTYTEPPSVTITTIGNGATAGTVSMRIISAVITNSGVGYSIGDTLLISGGAGTSNASILVTNVGIFGEILSYSLVTSGEYTVLPFLNNNNVLGGNGNSATFNLTTGVSKIELATGGSSYQNLPTVVITPSDGNGTGAAAISHYDPLYVFDKVGSIEVTSSGYGYTAIPTVTITNGSGAVAEAVLTGTGISTIVVDQTGSGYTYANIQIVGDGINATAHANIVGGAITTIVVDVQGTGYTVAPTIVIDGDGFGATAHSTLVPTSINYIKILNAGSNYNGATTVDIAGAATGYSTLVPTGLARVEVLDGGTNWVSVPMVYINSGPHQIGSVILPSLVANLGYGIGSISVLDAGSGYQTEPTVHIPAPLGANPVTAQAIAHIGSGTGTLIISQYADSRDYWRVWKNQAPSNSAYVRPYADRMDTVIAYFVSLGYTINRQTNPFTGNTIQWQVMW